jgi:protein-tyrosine phosphatase
MRRIDGCSLWIGTARDARDNKSVLDVGIEAIVDLAKMCEPVKPTRELVYLRFPLVDGGDNPPWLLCSAVHAVEQLARLSVPTLVACDGGMSRSLVIAAAALWLLTPKDLPDEVLRRVAANGPADVQPALWADVKRLLVTATEAQYRPTEQEPLNR